MNKPIRIIALTDAGLRLATRLQHFMPVATVHFKPKPFSQSVQQAFTQGDALIMICATGIAVRSLAPVLNTKHSDPPVLVLDELGEYVIPLLSGHEGGANNWAHTIAVYLQAQLVMTTAKPYLKPVYTVGMGCERYCPQQELAALFAKALQQTGLTEAQIHSINSIDIKADEQGLIALAQAKDKPYGTYGTVALGKMEHLLSTKSEYVFGVVGVYGVAESAALWAAQQHTGQAPELVLNKIKTAKATCAIARSYPAGHKLPLNSLINK
ncbi:cobalamin biosynthesis protein [Marinagarivorans algicola]|uniref:cobalamin biosynthesis protein n=1 Tax=Marinagarivorans algicola TaxID=1513270 RepID=UPI0006B8938B|nr:cobalamin biosynthesis protein [Marinagarivorans algicola]